ncbi:SusC/RagA family TonB-linked outer membrane protein [Epilithonimonas vandammei]|uniref:SusC/RagA family TonB-linked outer membrane protein n=1 Tax=Epilithonimonas vandammei TaxID=2487072 RepID=A0A3G8ZKM7_9FLAO|nr:SusC/RagA family TonB-linked outer membrane protein [Epilithonimonas vandammei]AZI40846.1 SusC/RagA family TonB-linked outer membrane protein [Epilithonimonas vandammei]AZI54481.1 SusC/RagA family TonB-linked outer membrane protein [Epilithonimonas vandammei]
MRNYNVLKIAPAFLLLGSMLHAQQNDSVKKETEIEQVVLIGYGAKKKTDLTGSITAISAKDFNEGSVNSPEQLIQGKASGIQITTNSGAPGAGSTIRIRGGASLNASNDPLIVIDGVPLDNNGISGASNPLALINPNDIESFNILKDASATAIYGSRASNGVIIITTKRGKTGKLKATYTTTTSVYDKMGTVEMLSADQFRDVVNSKAANNYKLLLGKSNTNWQKEIYQTAVGFDNTLSLSGGVKGLPYRLSLGYLNQDGIIKTNNIERSTASLNLNPKFFDNHLDINFNLKGTYVENRFKDDGAVGAAVVFDPTQSVFAPGFENYGGYFEWLDSTGTPNTNGTKNPLSMLNQRYDLSYVSRVLGNIQFDYKMHFLPELRANLNLGYDYSDSNGNTTVLPTAATEYYRKGSYRRYTQEKKNKLLEFYLNYTKDISAINSLVDITAGYSYQDWQRSEPFAPTSYGNGTMNPQTGNDFFTQNTLISYFARLNYTFDKKYLLTASVRRDASSRFSEDNRVGYFPSVALAWRIDQENFIKNTNVFSTLKLRVGWGQTGQQDINNNDYPYLARYVQSNSGAQYQIGDVFYNTLRGQGYDKNIKWETTTTKNLGLDFGFLNNRINGSIEVYEKETKDLLSVVPVPAGANLTNLLLTNVGDMRNRGIEFNMGVEAIKNENFSWEFNLNATHYKSEITNLASTSVLTGGISGGTGSTIQVHAEGYQPNAFYVYQQVYNQQGKPIEGVYVDRNGDGIINSGDLYQYKSPAPELLLGFSSRFTYKNWDLGFTMRASFGNYVYNNQASQFGNLSGIKANNYLQNIHTSYLDTQFDTPQYFSDYYVENGSFLRMDNINIGYNFPSFINENSKLRVFGSVQNAFLITNYSGLDPEVFNGIDNNLYQRPRVYSIGLNFQF